MNKILNFKERRLVLAPMVRISGLPMRLVALDYGADVVFCEEIIDYKMLQCRRLENKILDTIDFVWNDGTVVFRTCSKEKDRVIFQIGTSDANRAVKVAKMVEDCVAGVDVNMGCPKEFSIKGGMGAALMGHPEKFTEILSCLVKNISKPVSCKTRIKPTVKETLEMMRKIESTGVSWVTLHGRLKEERPNHDNHDDVIAEISRSISLPIIANGGSNQIKCHEDIDQFRESTNCSSVMIARAAMWNPSIFCKSDVKCMDEVACKFLTYCIRYDNHLASVKYCLQQLLHDTLETDRGRKLLNATSVREICELWNLDREYDKIMQELQEKSANLEKFAMPYTVEIDGDGNKIYQVEYKYNRKDFEKSQSSKMTLYEWCIKNKIDLPTYESYESVADRTYRTIVTFQGIKFASSVWDKSKKFSEQASACVCLLLLNYQPFYSSTFPYSRAAPPSIPYSERTLNHGNSRKNFGALQVANGQSVTGPNQSDVVNASKLKEQNVLSLSNIEPAAKKSKLDDT